MPLENWSENIVLAQMHDDPGFTDDAVSLIEQVEQQPTFDVVVDLANVNYLNSSNLAKLLRLRKIVSITNGRKLILCSPNTHVWGLFLTTGLNKTFEFAEDVSVALASVQIDRSRGKP